MGNCLQGDLRLISLTKENHINKQNVIRKNLNYKKRKDTSRLIEKTNNILWQRIIFYASSNQLEKAASCGEFSVSNLDTYRNLSQVQDRGMKNTNNWHRHRICGKCGPSEPEVYQYISIPVYNTHTNKMYALHGYVMHKRVE